MKNSLDVQEEVIHLDGVTYPVRSRGGILEYRNLPMYAIALNPPYEWLPAPEWAQEYLTNAMKELHTDVCRNCDQDIRMMVQRGTGFCCTDCEDQYADKLLRESLAS